MSDLTARIGTIHRNTTETQIALRLNVDGQGTYHVATGIRFFDHMMELFTRHGGFDLDLKVTGDLDVDQHHTVEDTGIALGEAFLEALGDKKGILRAGYFVMAMDECLSVAAVDLSGRTAYAVETLVDVPVVGDLQTELVTDFFEGFARGANATSTSRSCTAAATTTKSRPASKPSPAPCEEPAAATNACANSYPAPRASCS